MPEEERTEVEETEAEEKTVEETEVEEKTTEPVKEAPDAKEETKTTGGGGIDPSEIVEMLEAKLPKAIPLGCVLAINLNIGIDIGEMGCIGVFDGCVIGFTHISGEYAYQTEGGTMSIPYEDYKSTLASNLDSLSLDVLDISDCGSSLPSKDSTRFTVNITGANNGK